MPTSILGSFVLGLTAAIRRIRMMNRRVRRHILIDPIARVLLTFITSHQHDKRGYQEIFLCPRHHNLDFRGVRWQRLSDASRKLDRRLCHAGLRGEEPLRFLWTLPGDQTCQCLLLSIRKLIGPDALCTDRERDGILSTHRRVGDGCGNLAHQRIPSSRVRCRLLCQKIGSHCHNGIVVVDLASADECNAHRYLSYKVTSNVVRGDVRNALWRAHQLLVGFDLRLQDLLGIGLEAVDRAINVTLLDHGAVVGILAVIKTADAYNIPTWGVITGC